MASLLDERPAPKGPILFGRALVAKQQADAEAAKQQEQSRQFGIREQRLAQEAAWRAEREQRMLQLQERSRQLQERAQIINEDKAEATLKAAEMKLEFQARAIKQFGVAAQAVGKLDPKAEDYSERLAQIKAENPDAFTFGGDVTGSLDNLIKDKSGARELYLKSTEEIAKEQRTRADEAARMKAAQDAGMVPSQATIGGFTFKKLDSPQVFKSFDEAKAKYPDASLRGTVDSTGNFTVEHIGTKSGGGMYADDAPTEGAAPAAGAKPSLDQIFGAKK